MRQCGPRTDGDNGVETGLLGPEVPHGVFQLVGRLEFGHLRRATPKKPKPRSA